MFAIWNRQEKPIHDIEQRLAFLNSLTSYREEIDRHITDNTYSIPSTSRVGKPLVKIWERLFKFSPPDSFSMAELNYMKTALNFATQTQKAYLKDIAWDIQGVIIDMKRGYDDDWIPFANYIREMFSEMLNQYGPNLTEDIKNTIIDTVNRNTFYETEATVLTKKPRIVECAMCDNPAVGRCPLSKKAYCSVACQYKDSAFT